MKKYRKFTAALLALLMLTGVLAGCAGDPGDTTPRGTDPAGSTPSGSKPEDSQPSEPAADVYTWDIEVVYPELGEWETHPDVTLTFTNPGLPEWDSAYQDQELTFTPYSTMAELKVPDPSDWVVDNSKEDYLWVVDNGGYAYNYDIEVVYPLMEGDYESHGELLIQLRKPDYYWDVTVVYENGACGEYTFSNPGLEGWNSAYLEQRFTVTPENNTFALPIFDPSNWIVDNTKDWYKWVIFDNSYEGGTVTFVVVDGITLDNYSDRGVLEIHISLP